jgi:hypothetical protein
MQFFDEQDFVTYRDYLIKSVNETASAMAAQDETIKAFLIGEFPDGRCRFVTVHPYTSNQHKHHTQFDHYASLMLDLAPSGMSMFVLEVNDHGVNG